MLQEIFAYHLTTNIFFREMKIILWYYVKYTQERYIKLLWSYARLMTLRITYFLFLFSNLSPKQMITFCSQKWKKNGKWLNVQKIINIYLRTYHLKIDIENLFDNWLLTLIWPKLLKLTHCTVAIGNDYQDCSCLYICLVPEVSMLQQLRNYITWIVLYLETSYLQAAVQIWSYRFSNIFDSPCK